MQMTFTSSDEAMRFLMEEVTRLSDRVVTLENRSIAHKSGLSALAAFVGQIPPFSTEIVTSVLNQHADGMAAYAHTQPELADRWLQIADELRAVGFNEIEKPTFGVIEGGRSD